MLLQCGLSLCSRLDTCHSMANYHMKLLCMPSKLILAHFTTKIWCNLNYGFYNCHCISVNWFRYFRNLIIIFSVTHALYFTSLKMAMYLAETCRSLYTRMSINLNTLTCIFCTTTTILHALIYLNEYYFLLFSILSCLSISLLIADYGNMDWPRSRVPYCTQEAHQIQWAPVDIENRRESSTISKQYPK
jgi:hypothetical protein